MTRVREETTKRDARRGALMGLAATGGVITSAGFVLAGTFAALATIPAIFPDRTGLRGRLRHTAGHDRRAIRPSHRAEPRRRPVDVVAKQPGAQTRPATRRTQPRTHRHHHRRLTPPCREPLDTAARRSLSLPAPPGWPQPTVLQALGLVERAPTDRVLIFPLPRPTGWPMRPSEARPEAPAESDAAPTCCHRRPAPRRDLEVPGLGTPSPRCSVGPYDRTQRDVLPYRLETVGVIFSNGGGGRYGQGTVSTPDRLSAADETRR